MRKLFSHAAVALLASGLTVTLLPSAPQGPPPALAPQAAAQPAKQPERVHPGLAIPDGLEVSDEEKDNIRTYQQVNRSVVNITTRSAQADDFFIFGNGLRSGSGSGSVLDKQGHILTNYHVVEDARQIAVTLFDGTTHEAKPVGADPNNDLAVLKIDAPAESLHPIAWGDSNKLVVGLRVYAIGNPFGLERTLTTGIIGSLNRSLRSDNNRLIRGVIQTDAAINPGNSGGPLVNRKGEMIGITTAIVSRTGQSSGIGLAIPANTAHRVLADLIRFGRVIRPDLGINTVYELERGLLIAHLVPNGPAERAGLRGPLEQIERRGGYVFRRVDRSKADLILAADGKVVKSFDDLLSYVESKKPGEFVTVTVLREGKKVDVTVQLGQTRS